MGNKLIRWIALIVCLLALFASEVDAQRVRLGSVKFPPYYYLTLNAAAEEGYWKEAGLELEWVPFVSSSPLTQAVAAGAINMGMQPAVSAIQAAAREVPLIMVADLVKSSFFFWVQTESRIKKPVDLRGAKIGVSRLGGPAHAYARLVAKGLGLKGQVRFIGTGGIRQDIASLKAGITDVSVMGFQIMANLIAAQEIRELLNVSNYLARPWLDSIVFSRKDFMSQHPEKLAKIIKAMWKGVNFIRSNRSWALEKMKARSRYTQATAELVYARGLNFNLEGQISSQAVVNVRQFMIDYGLVPEDKMPQTANIYSDRFVP